MHEARASIASMINKKPEQEEAWVCGGGGIRREEQSVGGRNKQMNSESINDRKNESTVLCQITETTSLTWLNAL